MYHIKAETGEYLVCKDSKNSWNLTSNKNLASSFKTEKAAVNTISMISGKLRRKFSVLNHKFSVQKDEDIIVAVQPEDAKSTYSPLLSTISNIEEETKTLRNRLSHMDSIICDLLHKAEFEKLNAAEGYCLYRQLRETRIKRRQIKNDLFYLEVLKNNCDKEKIQQAIYKNEHKHYNKRTNEVQFKN